MEGKGVMKEDGDFFSLLKIAGGFQQLVIFFTSRSNPRLNEFRCLKVFLYQRREVERDQGHFGLGSCFLDFKMFRAPRIPWKPWICLLLVKMGTSCNNKPPFIRGEKPKLSQLFSANYRGETTPFRTTWICWACWVDFVTDWDPVD